jgi:hypothetical protein
MQACVGVFGEGVGTIAYTHASGLTYPVDGIFEAQTEAVDPDTGAMILSYQPILSLELAVLRELPGNGDRCVIRGKAYLVREPEFDGQGTVTLRLYAA